MRSGSAASCVRWWFHQGILRFEFFDASPDPCHARPGDGATPSTPNASTYRGRAHLRLRIPIINTPPHLALAVAVEVSQRSLDVSNFAQPSPWNGRIRYKLGHGSVNSTVTVKVRLQRRGSGRPYAPSPGVQPRDILRRADALQRAEALARTMPTWPNPPRIFAARVANDPFVNRRANSSPQTVLRLGRRRRSQNAKRRLSPLSNLIVSVPQRIVLGTRAAIDQSEQCRVMVAVGITDQLFKKDRVVVGFVSP
jgi:hypothetical protein